MYTWYLGRMFSFCLICYCCMSLSKSCPSVHFLKLDKTSVLRCWVLIFRSEAALVNNVLLSQTQSPKKLFFVCLILLNSKDRAEVKELSMYNNKKLYGNLVNVWRVSSLSQFTNCTNCKSQFGSGVKKMTILSNHTDIYSMSRK